METLNILWLNWRDIKNPAAGGAEIYTHEIAKRLVKRGHEVKLLTSKFDGAKDEENVDGVDVIRKGNKYSVYSRAREFYELYGRDFDLVIDEINTRPFHTPRYVKDGKIVALIHQLAKEFWFYETPFPVSLIGYLILERIWLRDYRSIPTVTVSNSTKEDLDKMGFKFVYVVRNGLNVKPVDEPGGKSERPSIVYVGRMKRAKKPQDVMEAFKLVKKEVRDAQLWMIGDGYLREKLESRKLEDVRFFGHLRDDEKNELVKSAWVIAVPGVREGWGQVVTDANALGTPAVGYDIPGLRDSIRHEYNGLLVDPDPKSMAEALIELLSNDGLRRRLGSNAIEWAKRFSWDRSAEEFEELISSGNGERRR